LAARARPGAETSSGTSDTSDLAGIGLEIVTIYVYEMAGNPIRTSLMNSPSMTSPAIGRDVDPLEASSRQRGPWNIYLIAAFPDITPGSFAIWEMTFRLGSDDLRKAIASAFSQAHEMLDDPVNIETFGYEGPPVLYAVTDVDHRYELPQMRCDTIGCILLRSGPTLSERELEQLKSFDKVSAPFRIMFIG
jgi:hypothetical protein